MIKNPGEWLQHKAYVIERFFSKYCELYATYSRGASGRREGHVFEAVSADP